MPRLRRVLRWALIAIGILALAGLVALAILYRSITADLPEVSTLRQIELQEPLYVHASDGRLMAVFGEARRYPVTIDQVPPRLRQAFLAIEDARFYEHGGVDYKGTARAVWLMLTNRSLHVPGGSTITQQVARQVYLSPEVKLKRKAAEMLLAMRMEEELSKDEIFALYLNKSFFGNRAYGVAAAAEFYYGKKLDELDLDEMASLAGIPKFPSSGNPLNNPGRAKIRRDYILDRMAELGYVSAAEAAAAKAVPMHAGAYEPPMEASAPYVAEMVRQEMIKRYGPEALTQGYRVTTTIDADYQAAADKAVRDGLRLYDHRHGWHGVERHVELAADADDAALAAELRGTIVQADLLPAIVAATATDGSAEVVLADGSRATLAAGSVRWTNKNPAALVKRGDVVRVRQDGDSGLALDQVPRGQAALVSLDANTGALRALVGGYSFSGNKFNRATQARRQPGSSFKPFVYAAAFEKGFNPASIVLDAPVVFRDRRGKTWSPQNDDGNFRGAMRLREALVQSRNLVSVRMLDAIGVDFARTYISQFGFDEAELPPNLSMSLGTASLTPMSVARGYAVFANGGSRVDTWFIDEVRDRDGNVVFKADPAVACRGCGGGGRAMAGAPQVVDGFNFGALPAPGQATGAQQQAQDQALPAPPPGKVAQRAIDERTAYQLVSMMRDVVQRGTGTAAKVLGREDVGGKTGSTNDHRDAWFSGFGGTLATTVWVGRDDFKSLGYREYGGKAALPIWIDYMRVALDGQPIVANEPPDGMVKVFVDGSGRVSTFGEGLAEYIKVEDLERMQNNVDYLAPDHPDEEAFDIF
ncbi:penicillin-binding protein, 1A family [Pseudoxanthomonas suwonensis 11-1]|uniref:Penicillin-binding protein 1A n=1 Tax=Pseudoxanthomonas suwonensis (strain 11-1) TaxID=743721 RepID=E6WQV2_PSEUU|nr:penicillin-binding protein 1A [Pseudoxanthomonas suwonensis]ADV26551.1 penicillin-binding protein, 1A family [Pseudoxanthomonas suwonensis 11-1]